jgi:hypothetical protein
VCLHLSTQHIWPQLSACLSIVCPFCISSHPQLGQKNQGVRESSLKAGIKAEGESVRENHPFPHAVTAHTSLSSWCIDRRQSPGRVSILNNHTIPNQTEIVAQLMCYSCSPPHASTCTKVEFGYMLDKN